MIVCVRTLVIYCVVLFALRVMGKSELSKTSTFQMVVLFMIAELASMPIDSPGASLINGIIAILTLLFLQVFFSSITMHSKRIKNLINGRPSVLIDCGQINVGEMKRLRITINELFEQLRINGCPSISDVRYAIMEANGELSVVTNKDDEGLPIILISDGQLHYNNLKKANLSEEAFFQLLEKRNIDGLNQVFLAFYDYKSGVHIYPIPHKNQGFSQEVI